MSEDSEKSLTPYMLVGGPLLLLGAFFNWPASDYIGERGVASLVDEADSLMPLMIVASLGTIIMFGGLYLLNSEMIGNAKGMNKQLLTVGSILIVASLVGFIIGMGSNVNVINAEMTDVDPINEEQTWASEEDQMTSQENFFDTGATAWALSPVTWGLAMIIIGLVAFITQRPEGVMDWFLPAWMPLGTAFLAAPILNEPSYFDMIFPVTILVHILLGILMMTGKITLPKCP